ncbi:MAG: efflux RND transporter periplasmic adaptor subunit [Firmicutes bacterium]|nr:efflux RND transporter periplasmic adaptor subunit [Bacillota bacterium]
MFKKKKILIILLVLVGIGVLSVGIFKTVNKKDTNKVRVSAVEVEKMPISQDIISNGIIKTKDQRNIVSELPYTIEKVLVKEGSKVNKGDILAKLNTKDLEYNLKRAEINLELEKSVLEEMKKEIDTFSLEKNKENAKITYEDSKKKYEKSKELYEAGAISKSKLETDKTTFLTAKNNYELAKNKLDEAMSGENKKNIESQVKKIKLQSLSVKSKKEDLEKSIIKSPINGTIVKSNAKIGVNASTLNPLFIIDDTKKLEIEVDVSEYDVKEINIGQDVKITGDAFESKKYEGKVSYIAPIAEVQKTNSGYETNVKIRVDILNVTEDLKPGFSADVSIRTGHKEDPLVVPYETIYKKKDGTEIVYKVENDKLKEVPITEGIKGDMKLEIISDEIKKGDKIVLNPTERLKDDMDVTVSGGKK